MQGNKVCIPAPHKLSVGRDVLEEAGCELVLGKDQDEHPKHRYTEDELVALIGDSDAVWAAQRDFISGAVLARCPKLRGVIKAAIGYETIDVDAATELGILVCNSPARENFTGVAEATVGLMSMLFKRLVHNQHAPARGRLEAQRAPRQPDGGPHRRHRRRRTGGQGGGQAPRPLGDAAHRLRPLHHPGVGAAPGGGTGFARHGARGNPTS